MSTLWESYTKYFREFQPILRDMAARGIPIDEGRRLELKALIGREKIRVDETIKGLVPAEVLGTKQAKGLKNAPKLKCEECGYEGRGDHFCTEDERFIGDISQTISDDNNLSFGQLRVVPYAALAEAHGLIQRPFTIGEGENADARRR